MDYRLSSVHGMLYTGGDVAFGPLQRAALADGVAPVDRHSMITTVNNQLTIVDLLHGNTRTHTCGNSNIQAFALSPDGDLALCIGDRGLGVFYSFSSELAIDTISIPPKCEVRCARFSPCGRFVAIALESTLQIYSCPEERVLGFHGCHRVEHRHNAMTLPITSLDWTTDSEHLLVAAQDAKITIFPRLDRYCKGQAALRNHLIGHRGALLGAFWCDDDAASAVSVSADNVVICWKRTNVTRKDLLRTIVATHVTMKVSGSVEDDEEDALPESFLERERREQLHKVVELEGTEAVANRRVTKGNDESFGPPLRFAFEVGKKHLLQQGGVVTKASYHRIRRLLAIGYLSGNFALYAVSDSFDVALVHALNVTSQSISALAFSATGDHVAIGSSHLKQLIVWDWRGESYLLKEQSHYYDINVTALTSDGATIVSGGEDGKVKVWKRSNGQCYANFADHSGGITGLVTSPSTNAFFTASKDGTCRGYDLTRYRNFRIFAPLKATQLSSISVDPSGEILAAGSSRSNVVTLWSIRTGKVIDEFCGHQGPITTLQFHPDGTALATAAIDKTMMLWRVFTTTNEGERLRDEAETVTMESEVLALSFSHNGKRLAVLLLNGHVYVYDAVVSTEPAFLGSFQSKLDASGGWHARVGPNSANAKAHFTSIALSPDGDTVLLAGESRWICCYSTSQGYLINKWPVTTNMDFEGAEEQFDYRSVTEAGVMIDDIDVADDDYNLAKRKLLEMPGSRHAHFATGKRKTQLAARSLHVAFASHGRDFVVATTAGLLVFSVDAGRSKFAPVELRLHVTTRTVRQFLEEGQHTKALIGALLLQDAPLGKQVLLSTPRNRMAVAIPVVPTATFALLVQWVGDLLLRDTHVDRALAWADALLFAAEEPLFGHARTPAVASALRVLHRAAASHRDLVEVVEENTFLLAYLTNAMRMTSRRIEPVVPSSFVGDR